MKRAKRKKRRKKEWAVTRKNKKGRRKRGLYSVSEKGGFARWR